MDVDKLNDAFKDFTAASKSLEAWYGALQEKIAYLTSELETRNQQLVAALDDAESTKDHLNAVLASLEEAIVVTDPQDRIAMLNRAAEKLFGCAPGRPFASLDIAFRTEGADTFLTAGTRTLAVIVSRSDVLNADGSLRGRVTLVRDISRLRELELRHERDQRLIAMGEMAAALVHEIRNPLGSMELYVSMLERELEQPSQRELAQGISAGISGLNAIMSNMLHFARPKRPAFRRTRLEQVAENALRTVLPLLGPRNIVLTTGLAACELDGDADLLQQAVVNILMNAVQAMPGGGRLSVTLMTGAAGAVLEVADTGVGIPREHLEKIFDPFFTTRDHGTGLGLVIATNLVRSHNGYIEVKSEPGKGSSFRLCFPAASPAVPRERPRRAEPKGATA